MYDQVIRGMIRARLEGIDLKLAETITNRLFQFPNDSFSGQDLMVLNIARGKCGAQRGPGMENSKV